MLTGTWQDKAWKPPYNAWLMHSRIAVLTIPAPGATPSMAWRSGTGACPSLIYLQQATNPWSRLRGGW